MGLDMYLKRKIYIGLEPLLEEEGGEFYYQSSW